MSLLILWIGIAATVILAGVLKYRSTERKLQSLLADALDAPAYNLEVPRPEPVIAPEFKLPALLADVTAAPEKQLAAAA
jgi:hypothetical protein